MKNILLGLLILSLVGLYLFSSSFNLQNTKPVINIPQTTTSTTTSPSTSHVVTLNTPAVDREGNGVVTKLIVEAKPGSGKVLVDINNLFFFLDTQNSIRVAQRVAQNFTKVNVSNYDLTYSVDTDASVIEGPSAGAALTVATIAALDGKNLNPNVSITGTIEPDGSVGEVGAIDSKANAAKNSGATLFLVPLGQGVSTNYKPIQTCEKIGPVTYCTTEYKAEELNISSSSGIKIQEVADVGEALNYFIEDRR